MSPIALLLVLGWGVLTMWAPEQWPLSLYQIACLALCAVYAPRAGAVWHPLLGCLAFVPLWGVLQLASGYTIYSWETATSILNWTAALAVFFVGLQIRRRESFLELVLHFGFCLSVLSTLQMFTSSGKVYWLFPTGYSDFVMGPFLNRNQYAAFVEIILPLALVQVARNPKPLRYGLFACVMIASVIASQSRAGTVLVLAEAVLIPALAARGFVRFRTAAISIGALALLSLALAGVVGGESLWKRFRQDDPYAPRREMLLASIDMVRARPALGFGLGTWPTAYPAYARMDNGLYINQAHNDWAQWAVEGGLPLLAAMSLFAAFLARAAWRSVWGLGLIAVLLHCLVDYPMQQRPALAGCFFAVAGVLIASETLASETGRDGLLRRTQRR